MRNLIFGVAIVLLSAAMLMAGYSIGATEVDVASEKDTSYAEGKLAGRVELKAEGVPMGCVHGRSGDLELMICHTDGMAYELICDGLGEAAERDPERTEKYGCYPSATILKE